ncbi:uncharacterized protein LOC129919986 [Episyrphus balteatus]|uniref:uncharacterized protein LOC129919986 n=1 Tax=Episyrphus balteatus TaxID=286459 RepID=UPI00248610B0|nr:uncharacterized protein LOC129919986 [Episyrphus balteatus]
MSQCNLRSDVDSKHKIVKYKSVKVKDSLTQIGPSLNNLSMVKNHKDSHFRVTTPEKQKNSDKHSLNAYRKSPKLDLGACKKYDVLSNLESRSLPKEKSTHTFQKKNNIEKEIKPRSIFTQKSQNSPQFILTTPRNDINIDSQISKNSGSPHTNRKTPERTASSILRHARLSKEILEHVKKHRPSPKTKTKMKFKGTQPVEKLLLKANGKLVQSVNDVNRNLNFSKKRLEIKQNVSIYNRDTYVIVNPEPTKSTRSKQDRSTSKSNNSTETSNLQNVKTIRPNVIDDSTYVCPDNSEENEYLLLPYVPNSSEERENRAELKNRNSLYEESSLESVQVLEDVSSDESMKPSLRKEKHPMACESHHDPQRNVDGEQNVSQTTNKSEYMSHRLEKTWESHIIRKGLRSSKFETSHYIPVKDLTEYPSQFNHKSYPKQYSRQKNELKTMPLSPKRNHAQIRDTSKLLVSNQGLQPSKIVGRQRNVLTQYTSDKNITRDQFHKSDSINSNFRQENLSQKRNVLNITPSLKQNQDTEKLVSTHSFLDQNHRKGQSFTVYPERNSFEDSLLNTNFEDTSDAESEISVSKLSQQNETEEKCLDEELFQHSSPVNTSKSSLKDVFEQKEVLYPKRSQDYEKNAFKTFPLEKLTKEEPGPGAIFKTPVLTNSETENKKLSNSHAIEATVGNDKFQQDTQQINNKEKIRNSEDSSLTTVFGKPRTKLTYSDNELIQEKIFKQGPYDLKSKSFCHQSNTKVPKKNAKIDQPQITKWKKEHHNKRPLLVHKEQIDSQESELTTSTKASELKFTSKGTVDKTDLVQVLLPIEARKNDTRKSPPLSESKISTKNLFYKIEPEPISQKSSSLASISVENSFAIDKRENSELGAISGAYSNDHDLLTNTSPVYKRKETSKESQTIHLKSESNHNASKKVKANYTQKYDSKLGAVPKTKTREDDFNLKSRFNKSSLSPRAPQFDHTKFKSHQNAYINTSKSQSTLDLVDLETVPKTSISTKGMSLNLDTDLDKDKPEAQKEFEKKPSDKEISTLRSKPSGSELGAIPKVNQRDFKFVANSSSLSLCALPTMNKDFTRKLPHSYTELNHSIGETFLEHKSNQLLHKEEQLEANDKNYKDDLTESQFKIYKATEHLPRDDIKQSVSQEKHEKLIQGQPTVKTNKSSSDQYSELFLNQKDEVKNSIRTSQSKFKQNLIFSIPSKPAAKKLQVKSSTGVFGTAKRDSNDISSGRKFSSISAFNLKKEIKNEIPTKIDKFHISNQIKPNILYSNKLSSFPEPEEGRTSSVIVNAELSNNQTENKMNERFDQNSLKSRDGSRLNETNEKVVNSEDHIFLSDTFNVNIPIEGVSLEVSDLIQHLQNRVKDCDQNVKNHLKTLEKLKTNCKNVESEEKKEEMTTVGDLKDMTAEEPLTREDYFQSDINGENSCHCIFCGEVQTTLDDSEEIPSFTGCDCMKEDYYDIMRIAYNK